MTLQTTEFAPILRNHGETLTFTTGEYPLQGTTTYNPSIPFQNDGRTVLLVRQESVYSETDTQAVCMDLETRSVLPEAPVFNQLQDPYYLGYFKNAQGEAVQVIGGVHITVEPDGSISSWQDYCYQYKDSISELTAASEPFFKGMPKWKDTRFVQTDNGIAVFPRPQGDFGGSGRVGFFMTPNLDTLQTDLKRYAEKADESTLIGGLFEKGEWGGINQVFPPNADGSFPFIGHRAHFTDQGRVYEGIAGLYDPTCNEVYNLEVILTGRDFDTKDVKDPLTMMPGNLVFIAGLVDIDYENLTATAYAGVGDLHVGARVIPLPTALRPHEYIGN